jgi:hypothetical protein
MFRGLNLGVIETAIREDNSINSILLYDYVMDNFLPDVSIDDFTAPEMLERLTDEQIEELSEYALILLKHND